MTLYDKIIELNKLGYDIKFVPIHATNLNFFDAMTCITLRYHGNAGVKIENSKTFTPDHMTNELFIVNEIQILYEEMRHHAYGDKNYYLQEHD
jgi:hypothetical protein